MRAYHRIVGDPPRRGFGSDIASVGFPGGNWAAGVTGRRLPPVDGVPFFDEQRRDQDALSEIQCAYELQALDFQKVAVVYSAEGMLLRNGRVEGRPHGYSDIVALTGDGPDTALTSGSPRDWLSYSGFLTLGAFWALAPQMESIEAESWTPSSAAGPAWTAALPQGMAEALLIRYWRSATARAFDRETHTVPVRVCLGQERRCREIISLAKAFFLDVLLPVLPGAALHILSMSAPVAIRHIQKFDPTALVFVYPENYVGEPNENLFDLRTNAFVPLAPGEAAFARAVMDGQTTPSLQRLYDVSAAELGNAKPPQDTPFMADFDIAFALFQMDHETLEPFERVRLWRTVNQLLIRRHGYTPTDADRLLRVLEERWLSQIGTAPVPLTDADVVFLMEKALREADQRLAMQKLWIVIRHQKARIAPFFAPMVSRPMLEQAVGHERITEVFSTLLREAWLDQPIGQAELDALCNEAFSALCEAFAALREAMVDYLAAFGKLHAEMALFIMPLARRYLDRRGVLSLSLNELMNKYIITLPNAAIQHRIREAADAMDADNSELLERYLVAAFCAHAGEGEAYAQMCLGMGYDMSRTLCRILSLDAQADCPVAMPLDNAQLNVLLEKLLPVSRDHGRVHQALSDYAQRMLDGFAREGRCALGWYVALDAQSRLIDARERMSCGIAHYVKAYLAANTLPAQGDFAIVCQWVRSAASDQLAGAEPPLKALYEALGDAGAPQVRCLWNVFSTLTDTLNLRRLYLRDLQRQLMEDWKSMDYFAAIERQRGAWTRAALQPDELLEGNTRAAAQAKLMEEMAQIKRGRQIEEWFNSRQGNNQNAFVRLWHEALNRRFAECFEALLLNAAGMDGIANIVGLAKKTGAEAGLQSRPAWQCANAILGVWQVIRRELPVTKDEQLLEPCRNAIGVINRLEQTQLTRHLCETLARGTLEGLKTLAFRKRMAAAFITAAVPGEAPRMDGVLAILPWDKQREKPFGEEGVVLLTQICALFSFAQQLHSQYPDLLHAALLKSHGDYTVRLRGAIKDAQRMIPWLSGAGIGDPAQALVAWLKG